MSTNINKYGANLHVNNFLVAPVTTLDTLIETPVYEYNVLDEEGNVINTAHYSIKSHEAAHPNRKIFYTIDGLYFFYGIKMSDLKNDVKDLKLFIKANGLVLGTEDFTSMEGNEFWVLNNDELDEWIEITPHNQIGE